MLFFYVIWSEEAKLVKTDDKKKQLQEIADAFDQRPKYQGGDLYMNHLHTVGKIGFL